MTATVQEVAQFRRRASSGSARRRRADLFRLLLSLGWLGSIAVVSVWAAALAPADPNAIDLANALAPPFGDAGILGTDQLGRDMTSRVAYGGRVGLPLALAGALAAGIAGVLLGATAGFLGGRFDLLVSRLCDMQLALPTILFSIIVLAFGGGGHLSLFVVLAWTGIPLYFRVVRGNARKIRSAVYVEAARVSGAGFLRIILRHVIPGLMPLALVTLTLEFSRNVMLVATLSYLGLGIRPPTPDWGAMVASGQSSLGSAWWVAVVPGLVVICTVLASNTLGHVLSRLFAVDTDTGRQR